MESDLRETKLSSPPLFKLGKYEVTKKRLKWGTFLIVFGLGLFALVAIIIYTEIYIASFHIRVDCNLDLPLNYNKCLKRGCIWVQRKGEKVPPCFYPHGYGYRSVNIRNTSNGYHVNLKREQKKTIFGNEVDSVSLMVFFETKKRLRMKFVDNSKKRYEVPLEVPLPPFEAPKEMEYKVDFENSPQFGVKVTRISSGTVVLDTNVPGLVFSNQFLQLTTKLASSYIYGLGEQMTTEYKHSTDWNKISLFARDVPPQPNTNLYGVHPFYMNLESNGNAHGVFFLNSNAMEFILQPHPALTFITTGGILDFYVFLGPSPEEVVQQYLQVIGLPMMPPYWALGFHLSRYGYHNISEVETVVNRTINNNIPFDVQHFDIDYMEEFKDFTVDEDNFGEMGSFVNSLQEKGIKTIIILDPGIASNKTLKDKYPPLSVGEKRNVFIKMNGTDLDGEVWPGKARFPDFSHPDTKSYWIYMCTEFRKQVKFDGLWIDMNEPSSFVDGSLTGCSKSSLNYPPYAAGVLGSKKGGKLFEKTICMDAEQYKGKHYDVHNMYGYFQSNVTFRTLSIITSNNRPMVLCRSTYAGSGRFAAHWLGDNFSTWTHLRASIPGILNFNLFGIPFVGADICGFNLNTTEELCRRWMQLGAFYPFSRNHNMKGAKDQDPAVFGDSFIISSRDALLTRYELLPYLYTLFHLAHTIGSTVARPLLHEFPKDKTTWTIDYQFLWGPALLISPIVHKGAKDVEAYFPEGIWYNFYTGRIVKEGDGISLTVKVEDRIKLHVRGGYILPLQKPNTTATSSRINPMGLYVAPDEEGNAKGMLFWDDGIKLGTVPYLLLEFQYEEGEKNSVLSSYAKPNKNPYDSGLSFQYLTLCKQRTPISIQFNHQSLGSLKWEYIAELMVLRIESFSIPIADNFTVTINY